MMYNASVTLEAARKGRRKQHAILIDEPLETELGNFEKMLEV
jgi:hypothetical protein